MASEPLTGKLVQPLGSIPLSSKSREQLLHWLSHSPPSMIWTAPKGAGMEHIAYQWVAAQYCQKKRRADSGLSLFGEAQVASFNEMPCGHCSSCALVQSRALPEIKWLCAEDGERLSIDDIRSFQQWAYLKSLNGAQRFGVIERADELAKQSQNALLKIFEEPPEGLCLLLLTNRPQGLLTTLRSRALVFRWSSPSLEEIKEFYSHQGRTLSPEFERNLRRLGFQWPEMVQAEGDDQSEFARQFIELFSKPRVDAAALIQEMVGEKESAALASKKVQTWVYVLQDFWKLSRSMPLEELCFPNCENLYRETLEMRPGIEWAYWFEQFEALLMNQHRAFQQQLALEDVLYHLVLRGESNGATVGA